MGKASGITKLQNQLTGALIGLARSTEGNEHLVTSEINKLVLESLFATLTNVNFDEESLKEQIKKVHAAKEYLVPDCSKCVNACGRNDDYNLELLWEEQEDTRALKMRILTGIREIAAHANREEGTEDRYKKIIGFIYKTLIVLGLEWETEELIQTVQKLEIKSGLRYNLTNFN